MSFYDFKKSSAACKMTPTDTVKLLTSFTGRAKLMIFNMI